MSKAPGDIGELERGLNAYPAKYAIVTSAPPAWRALTEITNKLKGEYAREWGYHFFFDESFRIDQEQGFPLRGFVKFDLLWHYLPQYEWVVWIDADAVITNRAIRLEKFTNCDQDLIIGYDANGHHTTVIFMRNTQLIRDFLWACNNAGKRMFLQHPWHEMEAMRYFLQTPPYQQIVRYRSVKELCPILHSEYEKFGMPANVARDYSWSPGDWILHLSALSLERRVQLAQHFADPSNYRTGQLNTP